MSYAEYKNKTKFVVRLNWLVGERHEGKLTEKQGFVSNTETDKDVAMI